MHWTSGAVLVMSMVASAVPVHSQDIAVRLDSTMRVAEREGFSGVVRVEQNGVTLLEKGYGLANRAARIPFTAATVVQIGSNTKDFTAVAVLQLVESHRLSLEDTLGKFFHGAPADKRAITVRQLMNHRAGFPSGIGGDFEPIGRAAFIDSAMKTRLLFAPGSRESYSNTGFSVLAAIIEHVTGKTYDAYVHDAILAPLGLRRTGFLLPAFRSDEQAHGYLANGTDNGTMLAKPHAPDGPWWNLRGNGGMLSTVGDMHRFYAALLEGTTLMTPATRALRFDPAEPIGLAGSDGVSFFLYERFPRKHIEIIIASTNAASKAPKVRREIGRVLGLPDAGDRPDNVARRPGGKPAPVAMTAVLEDMVQAINSGDTVRLRQIIVAHFAADAGSPPVNERLKRIGGLHEMLGHLTLERVEQFDDGPLEMTLRSAQEGLVVVAVLADRAEPYTIHGLQVRVGG
ncbi:MAG: serine hydrolase domain-containing protein [bacterium]